MADSFGPLIAILLAAVLLTRMFKTVDQAHVAVVTMFGKYRRVMNPGLNVMIPFLERIYQRVPIQNQTVQLQFATITNDQAQVFIKATVIFTVMNHEPETIQLVAFKFINQESFATAMTSAVEASVREFVATKKQAEILGLRMEITSHAKETLGEQLAGWGFNVVDLQITDLSFDAEVMTSMSRIVAATNAKTAATAEGEALLITRTKSAEAEGAAIRIAAENEATAARLRGQGLAEFRKALAQGLSESAQVLEGHGIDPGILAFTLWTETLREVAKEGKGNTIFLDGNIATMDDATRRLQAIVRTNPLPPAQ